MGGLLNAAYFFGRYFSFMDLGLGLKLVLGMRLSFLTVLGGRTRGSVFFVAKSRAPNRSYGLPRDSKPGR